MELPYDNNPYLITHSFHHAGPLKAKLSCAPTIHKFPANSEKLTLTGYVMEVTLKLA